MFVNKEACIAGIERFQNRQVRDAKHQEKEFHSRQRDGCGGHGGLVKLTGVAVLTAAHILIMLLLTAFEVMA